MSQTSMRYLLLSALLVGAMAQIQIPDRPIRIPPVLNVPPAAFANNPNRQPPVEAPEQPVQTVLPPAVGNLEAKILPPPLPPGPCATCSATFNVLGNDAIYLAGRTDLVIPGANTPANLPVYPLRRHAPFALTSPDPLIERRPQGIRVLPGDIIRVKAWVDRSRPSTAGINFWNGGSNGGFVGPAGMANPDSTLRSFGGLSAFYADVGGPLVGVFLDDSNPVGQAPPATERFTFPYNQISTARPRLRQIFYIGNGGCNRNIVVPARATRFFVGIADGFNFNGIPGFYDDNNGGYLVNVARWMRVGSNRFQLVNPFTGLACLSQCNGQCGSTYRLTPNQSIFLADRDDLTIPALGTSPLAPFPLQRHAFTRVDFVREQFPLRIGVLSTNMIRIRAAGSPGNNFWNGNGNTSEPVNSPAGFYEAAGAPGVSNVGNVGGISGFKSDRKGPIVGVFTRGPEVEYPKYLTPPPTINFTAPYTQAQTMFPAIRQVFYIGDGQVSGNQCRAIYVPVGAKYLHLGYADSWAFVGAAGFYEDNDGLATVMLNRFRRVVAGNNVYYREINNIGKYCKLPITSAGAWQATAEIRPVDGIKLDL